MSEDEFSERLTQRDSADGYAYWIAGGLVGLGLVMFGFAASVAWFALWIGAALATFCTIVMLETVYLEEQSKEGLVGIGVACALNATAWVIIIASLNGIFT
jgi:hypothetical protein